MPGMDSKILLGVEFLTLVCLFSMESGTCSTDGFQIFRETVDSFRIPRSKCNPTNQTFDYCLEYNAKKSKGNMKTPCDCSCDTASATFEFRNYAWSCQKNNETRASFGCGMLFDKEDNATALNLLRNDRKKKLMWKAGPCTINFQDSSYISCHGKKVSMATRSANSMFQIEGESDYPNLNELEVEFPSRSVVEGRIVTLELECKDSDGSTTKSCLLFKLGGGTSCPVVPTTPFPTVVDTAINTEVVPSIATSQTQIFLPPNSSADKQTGGLDNLSVFLIVGLTLSLSALFVIVGVFVYRRNCARDNPYWDAEEHSSHSNPDSERSEKDPGYASLSHCTTTTYASTYHIPSTLGGISTLGGEDPIYSTVDEYQDPAMTQSPRNERPLSMEQRVYNLVEALDTSAPVGTYEYCSNEVSQAQSPVSVDTSTPIGTYEHCSNEVSQAHSPVSVEQRVYNIIEGLDLKTAEDPNGDGAKEGNQENQAPPSVEQRVYNLIEPMDNTNASDGPNKEEIKVQAPISVGQRLYNIIEPLDTVTCQQDDSCDPKSKEIGKHPLYNILGEPSPSDIEHGDKKESSRLKDPIYNVLEEPKLEETKEPRNASLDSSWEYEEPI